jgi:DNA recombination protein RmuC
LELLPHVSILIVIAVATLVAAAALHLGRRDAESLRGQLADSQALAHSLETALREKESRTASLEATLASERESFQHALQREREAAREAVSREREVSAERAQLLESAEQRLASVFGNLAAEALRANSQSFAESAGVTVSPLKESLQRVDERIGELERVRAGAYAELRTQIGQLGSAQKMLEEQAGNLVKALKEPHVRGRWGEIQLKKVIEIAGLVEQVDYLEQSSVQGETSRLRPDVIIRLPHRRQIVVDSKAPLKAYLEALEAKDEAQRTAKLREHAQQVRKHIGQLASKNYWNQLDDTPDFVVCFLPGETFFSAALAEDPSLIEAGVDANVVLATPTTLIALLKTAAYAWQQERIAESAQEISELGQRLYERLVTLTEHLAKVGSALSASVEAYNSAIGSYEARVLPAARKFEELGTPVKQIPELKTVETKVRDSRQSDLGF